MLSLALRLIKIFSSNFLPGALSSVRLPIEKTKSTGYLVENLCRILAADLRPRWCNKLLTRQGWMRSPMTSQQCEVERPR